MRALSPIVTALALVAAIATTVDSHAGDDVHICHGSLSSEADGRFLALFGRRGKLRAAVGNKRPRQLMAARKLLASGASFEAAIDANT